ncbi:hypothetical protein [Janthinobacterium agaricidamnosum]|uniref:Uncharacterized protein n=1 Tax=Janthinobacterium agaricidamnosum NBRC 102515 = DSM 9628 TaxID=1349767 RepID=W0V4C3_9BURK|nr:hypothetical protein [Janthinobacterium agaricidamnosum]CDG82208.1 hypothetical protein GJA_1563 [Janthinobacterium agaricidamnosum NBRC 102515 = DSM 9628]
MSQLPALGSRPYQTPGLNTPAQQDGKTGGKSSPGDLASPLMGRAASDAVALSKNGLDLSAQGLKNRSDALGGATIDLAQNFMTSFAQSLLGDAAKGATLTFDSASVSAQAGFSAQVQHGSGPDGGSDSAAFSLDESSHFIGKGKITTADGQTFEFEVEVQYQSRISAASAQGSSASPDGDKAGHAASGGLPTTQLPDIAFPGSLNDLFALLGKHVQGDVSTQASGSDTQQPATAGTLNLRLLKLINNASPLDLPSTEAPDAQARAKALADAYGSPLKAPATEDKGTLKPPAA